MSARTLPRYGVRTFCPPGHRADCYEAFDTVTGETASFGVFKYQAQQIARALNTEHRLAQTDLRRAHVTLEWEGRTLLGEIVAQDGLQLRVRYFNGQPWPLEPRATVVTILERA